jgi:HK97 family phage major capsid protein
VPIGSVTFGAATAAGVPFEAEIPTVDETGTLKEQTDLAAHLVAHRLIRHVSLGMIPKAMQPLKDGVRVVAAQIRELSLVAVPSNLEAAILSIKSASALHTAAASGPVNFRRESPPMDTKTLNIPAAVKESENHRATVTARMTALMTKAAGDGVSLDEAEATEYDDLTADLKRTDEHIGRLKALESVQIAAATPVLSAGGTKAAGDLRGGIVRVKPNVPPGTSLTRYAMAMGASRGDFSRAIAIAEKSWNDSTPEVALALKAAMLPGSTTDPAWAGNLVSKTMRDEFIELLRPATIIGKIPGLRHVPFNTQVALQTLGGVYNWVGQGKAKPVTKLGFGTASLGMSKAAGIITLTEELVRSSSPSAEDACRRDMVAGIAAFLDLQFIDPAVVAVPDTNPASITNGAGTIAATDSPWADISALIKMFVSANVPLTTAVLVMSEANAFQIGLTRNALGQATYPGLTGSGGTLNGIPVVTSNTANGWVVLINASDILIADDGGVTIDVSREATLQLDSAPMSPPDATTVQINLWQHNLVGLRAERYINWQRARQQSVVYATGADYQPLVVTPGTLR